MIAGDNPHYVHSLVQALASSGLGIDLIGGDTNERFKYSQLVKFINLGLQDITIDVYPMYGKATHNSYISKHSGSILSRVSFSSLSTDF
jgi:hypothetical protein